MSIPSHSLSPTVHLPGPAVLGVVEHHNLGGRLSPLTHLAHEIGRAAVSAISAPRRLRPGAVPPGPARLRQAVAAEALAQHGQRAAARIGSTDA